MDSRFKCVIPRILSRIEPFPGHGPNGFSLFVLQLIANGFDASEFAMSSCLDLQANNNKEKIDNATFTLRIFAPACLQVKCKQSAASQTTKPNKKKKIIIKQNEKYTYKADPLRKKTTEVH